MYVGPVVERICQWDYSMPRYTGSMCFATNVFPVNKSRAIKRKGMLILNQLNSNRKASFGYSCLLVSTLILETCSIYPQIVFEVSVALRSWNQTGLSCSSFPVHELLRVEFNGAISAHPPVLVKVMHTLSLLHDRAFCVRFTDTEGDAQDIGNHMVLWVLLPVTLGPLDRRKYIKINCGPGYQSGEENGLWTMGSVQARRTQPLTSLKDVPLALSGL